MHKNKKKQVHFVFSYITYCILQIYNSPLCCFMLFCYSCFSLFNLNTFKSVMWMKISIVLKTHKNLHIHTRTMSLLFCCRSNAKVKWLSIAKNYISKITLTKKNKRIMQNTIFQIRFFFISCLHTITIEIYKLMLKKN